MYFPDDGLVALVAVADVVACGQGVRQGGTSSSLAVWGLSTKGIGRAAGTAIADVAEGVGSMRSLMVVTGMSVVHLCVSVLGVAAVSLLAAAFGVSDVGHSVGLKDAILQDQSVDDRG